MFTELAAKNRNQKRKQKVEEKKKCFAREIADKEREGDKKKWDTKAELGKQIIMDLQIGFLLWLLFCVSDFLHHVSFSCLSPLVASINLSGRFMAKPISGCNPLSFIQTLCWTADLRHILPALLVCTPAGNGTDWALLYSLLHLWPSFRPFLVFLATCLTSRVACILTRQSGSPSFGTKPEVPAQSRPDTPSKIPLHHYSKPWTEPRVVPKIHH